MCSNVFGYTTLVYLTDLSSQLGSVRFQSHVGEIGPLKFRISRYSSGTLAALTDPSQGVRCPLKPRFIYYWTYHDEISQSSPSFK